MGASPEAALDGCGATADIGDLAASMGNAGLLDLIASAPPPTGEPDDGGLIGQASRSLGVDLSGVRLHSGDGVAEAAGAAAVARGQDIHVANLAVGADGAVEPGLLAHELAHVPQQQQDPTGGDLESEADRAGDAIRAGRPFSVEGGTGGPALQKETWIEWLYGVNPSFTVSTPEVEGEESQVCPPEEAEPQTFYGTDTPILDEEREPKLAPVGAVHDGSSTQWDDRTQIPTGRETVEGATEVQVDGDTTSTEVDKTSTGWSWPSLSWTWSHEEGTTTSTVDHAATAGKVKVALEEKASGIERQLEADVRPALVEATKAHEDVAGRRRGLVDEERRRLAAEGVVEASAVVAAVRERPEYAQLEAAERSLATTIEELQKHELLLEKQAAEARAAAGGVAAANAATLADEHGVLVEAATTPGGSTATDTQAWDGNAFDDGKVGFTDTTIAVDHASGTTTTDAHGVSVKAGGGLMVEDVRRHETAVGAPGQEVKSGSAQTYGLGLAAKGDGEYGAGATIAFEDTRDGTTTSMQESRQLTNEGYYAQSELGAKRTSSGGAGKPTKEGGVKVGFDRRFTVESRPVPDSHPPVTDLVVTVHAGGTVGVNAAVKGDEKAAESASASAEGAVGGSATLVFTHRLSAEEAEAYLGALDAVEAGQSPASGAFPELDLLGRMQVVGDQVASGDPADALAVVDAAGARSLGAGDSVELTLTGSASAKGELGASAKDGAVGAGAKVNGGASGEASRKVTVTTVTEGGQKLVELTVSFSSKSSADAGAKGTYGIGEVGASYATSESSGEAATFRLDPESQDFDAVYDTIVRASSLAELRALESDPAIGQQVSKRVQSEGGSETIGGTAGASLGVAAGELALTNKRSHANEIVTSGGEVGGTITGSNEWEAKASLNGVVLGSETSAATAAAELTRSGAELEFQRSDSGSRIGAQTLPSPGEVVTDGPKKALEKALTDSWSRVRQGTRLDEREVRVLFGRAREKALWSRCAEFAPPRVYLAWMTLAADLVSPVPHPGRAAIDVQGAREVAQLEAIAAFVERHGEAALAALRNATHHWGQGIGQDEQLGDDLGSTFEWPEGIIPQRDEYDELKRGVADLPSRLASASDVDGRRMLGDLGERLERLYTAVSACHDFIEPRAKMDLLDSIGQFQGITHQISGQFERDEPLDPNSCSKSEGLAIALAEVGRLESLMEQYKVSEATMFGRIKRYLPGEQETYWEGFKATQRAMWAPHEVNVELSRLSDLYEAWVADIMQLRSAYHASGTADAPIVSLSPQEPRNVSTEPDIAEFNRIWSIGQRTEAPMVEAALADHIRRFARY